MRSLGVSDAPRLTSVSTTELLDASVQASNDPQLLEPFGHVVVGQVLPRHPPAAVNGSVDLLIGTCNMGIEPFMGSPVFPRRFETLARQATGDRAWDRLLKAHGDTPPSLGTRPSTTCSAAGSS